MWGGVNLCLCAEFQIMLDGLSLLSTLDYYPEVDYIWPRMSDGLSLLSTLDYYPEVDYIWPRMSDALSLLDRTESL